MLTTIIRVKMGNFITIAKHPAEPQKHFSQSCSHYQWLYVLWLATLSTYSEFFGFFYNGFYRSKTLQISRIAAESARIERLIAEKARTAVGSLASGSQGSAVMCPLSDEVLQKYFPDKTGTRTWEHIYRATVFTLGIFLSSNSSTFSGALRFLENESLIGTYFMLTFDGHTIGLICLKCGVMVIDSWRTSHFVVPMSPVNFIKKCASHRPSISVSRIRLPGLIAFISLMENELISAWNGTTIVHPLYQKYTYGLNFVQAYRHVEFAKNKAIEETLNEFEVLNPSDDEISPDDKDHLGDHILQRFNSDSKTSTTASTTASTTTSTCL